MKKVIFSLILTALFTVNSHAQVAGNAIGGRLGSYAEVSFQTALSSSNRLELDLGLNNYNFNYQGAGFGLTGVYQWVWDLSDLSNGFNWYAGVGGTIGTYRTTTNTNIGLGVTGQIGLEYNFDIPLQLSLDYRPSFFVVNYHNSMNDVCIGVRYKF